MTKNPVLQKKFEEGYKLGVQHGIERSTAFFKARFEGLEEVPGIGEKTLAKIKKQLGEQYFKSED